MSLLGKASSRFLGESKHTRFERGDLMIKYAEEQHLNKCAAYHSSQCVQRAMLRRHVLIGHIPEGAQENPPQDHRLLKKKACPTSHGSE